MSTNRREYEYGRIVSVDVIPLGDNLAADAASGASSITVEDAADFDEDGGLLLLGGVVYKYTTWTEDESTGVGTITLTGSTLAAAATEGTVVSVYDPLYQTAGTDKVAQVELVGDDGNVDTLEAQIALHLVDKLDEGVRGLNGEQVKLELEGDEWVIVDIFGLGDPNASGTLFMQDSLTVAAAGTQTLNLSFEPIANSEHLYWNGLYQPGTEWSRSGQVVTITDPSNLLASGDVLTMEYAYRKGARNPVSIPLGYEWLYATGLGSSTTYAQPGFNDSAWSLGRTDMGYSGADINTTLSSLSNVWQRVRFISGGGALTFSAPVGHDDAVTAYLDGVQIYTASFTSSAVTFTVSASPGPHVVAVYGVDTTAGGMRVGFAITEAP